MNVLEKMKLNGQLNDIYLEIVGATSVLEKMKLNGQINDIYLKLNAGGIDTPSTPDTPTTPVTPEQGAKYWYGMRIRPIGFGTQPDNHIAQMSAEQAAAKFPEFTERDYRYGAVGYAEALSARDIEHYNLTDFQKVVNFDGDIDVAEVAIEDAILAKLKSLKVSGLTQSEIHTYLQAFDLAKGSNKEKIQSLFAKELRKDYYFLGRKTDPEGYKTWLASLELIDKAMLTKHLNNVLIAGNVTPETPAIERDEVSIKSAVNKAVRAIKTHEKASDEWDAATDKLEEDSALIFDDYGNVVNKALHRKHQSKIDSAAAKARKASEKVNQSYAEFRDAGGSNDEWDDKVLAGIVGDGWTGEELAEETGYLTPAEIAKEEAERKAEKERLDELKRQQQAAEAEEEERKSLGREERKQARKVIRSSIKSYVDGLGTDPRLVNFNDWDVEFTVGDNEAITSGVQRFSLEDENYTFDASLFITADATGKIVGVKVLDEYSDAEPHEFPDYQSLTMTEVVDHLLSLGKEDLASNDQQYVNQLNALKALTIADFNTLSASESKAKFYDALEQQETIIMKLIELDKIDEHTPLILAVGEHIATLKAESVNL